MHVLLAFPGCKIEGSTTAQLRDEVLRLAAIEANKYRHRPTPIAGRPEPREDHLF